MKKKWNIDSNAIQTYLRDSASCRIICTEPMLSLEAGSVIPLPTTGAHQSALCVHLEHSGDERSSGNTRSADRMNSGYRIVLCTFLRSFVSGGEKVENVSSQNDIVLLRPRYHGARAVLGMALRGLVSPLEGGVTNSGKSFCDSFQMLFVYLRHSRALCLVVQF